WWRPDRSRTVARATPPSTGLVRSDLDALPADLRPSQRRDDATRQVFRHFDERIAGVHADLANLARGEAGFTGDRTDEIAGPHAAVVAGADVQQHHRPRLVALWLVVIVVMAARSARIRRRWRDGRFALVVKH